MNEYSLSQIKNMQEEATRRVREMQQRSKQKVEQTNRRMETRPHPPAASPSPEKPDKDTLSPTKKHGGGLHFLKSLDLKQLIGEDSEQTMLLLLILLLLRDDHSDDFLIYALLYIML